MKDELGWGTLYPGKNCPRGQDTNPMVSCPWGQDKPGWDILPLVKMSPATRYHVGQNKPYTNMWLNFQKFSSLEQKKKQNDNHWTNFDFFTERSNMLPAKGMESRLAQT